METTSELATRLGVSHQRASQIRHPEKHQARVAVALALKSGKLTKPALCEGCEQPKRLHGHHDDYSKPLEVRWLCGTCHGQAHSARPKRKPVEPITDDMLRAAMAELGRRGGKKTSKAKAASSAKSLEKARELRWAK